MNQPRVLLSDRELGSGSAADDALGRLAHELRSLDIGVVQAATPHDVDVALAGESGIAAAMLEWDGAEHDRLPELIDRIQLGRPRSIPVFVLTKDSQVTQVPIALAERTSGFFWLGEDTPAFVAGRVGRSVRSGEPDELPPFFGALKRYTEDSNWNWSCPGHQGGAFYRKTPVGKVFFDFLGENLFRADLCNANVELGSLLQHEGPVLDAERRAADVFGAERTYFVLNGTSTSNKMVTLGLLSPGDLVLFDRNCHKSMHHGALMLGGATPIYLNPTRGASGIIGPIDHDALNEQQIREKICANPLVTDPDAWRRERPFRLAVLTNTTYDGVCYDAAELLERLGHLCDYVVFDEAWMAYAKFHPLYRGRFAMDLTDLGPQDPGIFATQSTHKCLAGLSQASQIHVRDAHIAGQARRLEHERFNEVFMMHTSTSPQYNLIASLDVGAQIMEGEQGVALMDEAIRESIALRKLLLGYAEELGRPREESAGGWFFGVFGPDTVDVSAARLRAAASEPRVGVDAKLTISAAAAAGGLAGVPWRETADDILASVPECWMFRQSDTWHDLTGLAPGYVMLDPTKCTITTPGIDTSGAFEQWGIPAAIPAAILRARGIVSEKTSFYTMLVLITAAIERGKSATLASELLHIRREFDRDAPLREVLPQLVAEHPERYGSMTLPELCSEMHEFLRDHRADRLQHDAFSAEHQPEIAMAPAAAHSELVAGRVELLPLDQLEGRIAATLIVAYPPGIAAAVPGERFAPGSAAIAYLRLFEDSDNLFPGFLSELQGTFRRDDESGRMRYHTYVVRERP